VRTIMLANGAAGEHHLAFVIGFASARTVLINNSASGLRVRFRKVRIATGTGAWGSSTGKTLSEGCWLADINAWRGSNVRKRPFATSLVRMLKSSVVTVARGGFNPLARNTCGFRPIADTHSGALRTAFR